VLRDLFSPEKLRKANQPPELAHDETDETDDFREWI